VNILDVKKEEIDKLLAKEPNKLKLLFSECRELQTMYQGVYKNNSQQLHVDKVVLDTVEGQLEIKQMIWNVTEELFEMANSFKNRAWTTTNYAIDTNRVYDELADSAIFFIHLIRKLGLDEDKFAELILRKIEVNKFRIRSHY
jgi:hypothetical protein